MSRGSCAFVFVLYQNCLEQDYHSCVSFHRVSHEVCMPNTKVMLTVFCGAASVLQLKFTNLLGFVIGLEGFKWMAEMFNSTNGAQPVLGS